MGLDDGTRVDVAAFPSAFIISGIVVAIANPLTTFWFETAVQQQPLFLPATGGAIVNPGLKRQQEPEEDAPNSGSGSSSSSIGGSSSSMLLNAFVDKIVAATECFFFAAVPSSLKKRLPFLLTLITGLTIAGA